MINVTQTSIKQSKFPKAVNYSVGSIVMSMTITITI